MLPNSLLQAPAKHQTTRYADPAACALLEHEALHEAWATVQNRVNSYRHVVGFLGMHVAVDAKEIPSPGT